jgi:hypothetical protein
MNTKNKPAAILVDADIIAYRSAAVAEERCIEVKHKKTGRLKSFKTRTDFKDFLKSKDFPYKQDEYEVVDIQTPEPVGHACKVVKNLIDSIQNKFKPKVLHILLGGKENFRDTLPLPSKYKGSRVDLIRPVHLQDVRNYLTTVHKAEVVHSEETDDAVIYYGYEYLKLGYDVTICTNDKDAQAYSGLKTYDFTKEDAEPKLIPGFGSLWIDDKGAVKGNGFLWYCFQHVRGDPTDNFCPYEISGKRFGEKSAYTLLKDCKSEQDALGKVIWQYKQWYPDNLQYTAWDGQVIQADYLYLADLYFKCCRMKCTKDDDLDFKKFCQNYGVIV